jgi:hypothetical protein
MTIPIAASSAPPVPPGQLTVSPSPADTLAFLEALDRWTAALRDTLDQLDADAQLADTPGAYTSDITLAMSLYQSIATRRDELVTAWDSGRVGPDELAHLALLMWGRLPDPLGAASAFTLTEAGTLAAALTDRLAAALSADAVAGSGVAGRIVAVRDAIARCRTQAGVLGIAVAHIDELDARLEAALDTKERERITTTVAAVDGEVTTIERDLIKETSLRAGTAHLLAKLQLAFAELEARTPAVVALARRCRSRIIDPPKLAVPKASVLGPPPAAGATDASTASEWAAARAELDQYGQRLERCTAALDEAEQEYGAPLEARDDLRGLVGAYRTRAARSGLAEDAALGDAYQAAHDVLWVAPCDLDRAKELVDHYQRAVRIAVGAEHAVEPSPVEQQPVEEQPVQPEDRGQGGPS